MIRWSTLALVLMAACRPSDREDRTPHGSTPASVPETKLMSTLPPTGTTPMGFELTDKMAGPETVIHDIDQDVYFVSNIKGDANAEDDNGYISKMSPSGELLDPYFIDGRQPDIKLNGPRGMAIGGDTLYVADEGGVRLFDRKTGDQLGSWELPESKFLNSVAIDPQGRVLVTDTGIDLLPTGPVKTGPYVIHAFDANGKDTILAQGDDLHGPNGIVSGPDGTFVVEFMDDEHGVFSLDDKGGKHLLGTLPFGELDGLQQMPDGSLLVTSWLANGVYRFLPGQPPTLAVEHVATPAGILYDATRDTIVIPEVLANTVHLEKYVPPSYVLSARGTP